ncbi:MAG: DNA methylase [Clostridia bacterium]|nr:DNA methylase [Clostridia bacterium]
MSRVYACIDLKSFYASVECKERGLDPLITNLVVADESRTEKTVCLAITPSMKQYGLGGRARLYEVIQKVKQVNYDRKRNNNYKAFTNKSVNDNELKNDKRLELDFIIAPPRMAYYMDYSTKIYNVYLKYLSADDIYVYSIDEVFCDLTNYLQYNNMTPRELVTKMIHDVYETTGITATGGIGTNMYLAKVAMDIVAKHTEPDKFGVRMAELDEMSYREKLWSHKPLTSFWRVGPGYTKKLESKGIYTMGDIARCSIENEELLYKLFGVNAELLIDHAWGWEPCTIKDIKSYKPERNSISSGQVLHCPYTFKKAKIIIKEMADLLALDLVKKNLVTNQLVLTIGYDIDNLTIPEIRNKYDGDITYDHYGREVPKHAHGTINIDHYTSSSKIIMDNMMKLFEKIINKDLLIRRVNVVACNVVPPEGVKDKKIVQQFDLFSNNEEQEKLKIKELEDEKEEKKVQEVLLSIKNRFGKNAILKGMNLEEGGTTIERNGQIGGHKG